MSTALNIIQDKFEEFAQVAAPLFHITNVTEYEQALQVVEDLLEQVYEKCLIHELESRNSSYIPGLTEKKF